MTKQELLDALAHLRAEVERLREVAKRVDSEYERGFNAGYAEAQEGENAEIERLTQERDEWQERHRVASSQFENAIQEVRVQRERADAAERERDDALALNSVNESGANNALDLLESMKTLCEAHMARADAAERQVATLREALQRIRQMDSIEHTATMRIRYGRLGAIADSALAATEKKDD